MFDLVDRVLRGYTRALDMLGGLFLAVMVVLVFGNVVLRYAFNSGLTMSEEVSRWLFVWLTFMGAVVALREHGHLGTDVLVSRLPRLGKKICLVLAQVAMLYVSWLLLKGSWVQAEINWDTEAPVTGASMAIVYAAGAVFAVCAALILLTDGVRLLTGRMSVDELVAIQESEEAGALAQALGPHGSLGALGTSPAAPPAGGSQHSTRS